MPQWCRHSWAQHGFSGLDRYTDPHSHVGDALDVRGIPTTFLLDSDGNILGRLEGSTDWSGPDAQALIDWALHREASHNATLPTVEPTRFVGTGITAVGR